MQSYSQDGIEPRNEDPCTHLRTGGAYEITEVDTIAKDKDDVWVPAIAYRRQDGSGPLFVRERDAFKQNFGYGHDWSK